MEERDQAWQEEIRLNHDNAAAVMAEEEDDGMLVESSPAHPTDVPDRASPASMDAAPAGSSSCPGAPQLNQHLTHLGGALPAGVPSTSSLEARCHVQLERFLLTPQASPSFPQASPTSSSPHTDSSLQEGGRSARTSGLRTSSGDEQGITTATPSLAEALSPQLVSVREVPFARGIPFSRVRVTLEAQTLMRKLRLRRLRDGTVRQSRALVRTLKRLERQLAEFQYRMQVLLLQLQRLQSVEQELQEQRQAYLQGNEE